MAGIRASMTGVSNVLRNISQASQKIEHAIQSAVIETALVDIETEAKMKLTSDGHIDTGRLRASIHTAWTGGRNAHNYSDMQGNSYTDILPLSSSVFEVLVGTTVEYAEFVEDLDSFLFFAFNKGKLKLKDRIKNKIARAF